MSCHVMYTLYVLTAIIQYHLVLQHAYIAIIPRAEAILRDGRGASRV